VLQQSNLRLLDMKTIATITGQPRIIKTAGGDRSLVYAKVASGDKHAIYRAAGDPEITGLREGQEVEISIGATGHAELVIRPQMGFSIASLAPRAIVSAPTESQRSLDIKDYITRLGKLYGHCYTTASSQLGATGLANPEVKDVATSLFIRAVRHFQYLASSFALVRVDIRTRAKQ
jgi:hypothetical protein